MRWVEKYDRELADAHGMAYEDYRAWIMPYRIRARIALYGGGLILLLGIALVIMGVVMLDN